MTAAIFLLVYGQTPAKPVGPTLQFYQDKFIVEEGTEKTVVPTKPEPAKLAKTVLFRKNQTFVVWDQRGLTVRVGKKARSTRLPEVAVTPRLFTREQILNTRARIKRGVRSANAAGVSGSYRIGNDIYFLLRWEEKSNQPWLEALVKVDLSQENPKPQLLGRYTGLSLANQEIDQRLFVKDGRLAAVTRVGPLWGVSAYDPKTKEFAYLPVGEKLQGFALIGKLTAVFIEGTAYGPSIVGRADLDTGERSVLFESRGFVRLLDHKLPPLFVINAEGKRMLKNSDTSAQLELSPEWDFARAGENIVAWTPPVNPKAAKLYKPQRWQVLASWARAAK